MKTQLLSSTGSRGFFAGLILTCLAAMPFAASAQLTGIKTVGTGGDYATIALAITDLNTMGVGLGGVTFNVVAGHTETAPAGGFLLGSATLNASTSAANPVIFQKSGSGANPLITSFVGTSTSLDGIWKILGTDYLTINGIDLVESAANTTSTTRMEWGYALLKRQSTAPFDGCQYVTITNCTITLNKANTVSKGIYSGNHIATATTSLTLTATTDAMYNCTFQNNIISNVYIGISLNGSSTATYYDLNNLIDGNQVTNYGGGSATAYGIYTIYNGDMTISNNTFISGTGTTTTLYGIFCSTATSKSVNITGNNVTITGGGTTSAMHGINNAVGSTAAGNTVNISANNVTGCSYPTATTGVLYPIVNSATAATVNIFNNIVDNNVLPGTGAFIGIYNSASMGTTPLNIYGNTITNNSKTGTSGVFYGCQAVTATISFYQNVISDNSVAGGSSTFYGYYNGSSPATETYHSNQIFNLTHYGTGTLNGIQISTAIGIKNVYNNQIYNLTSGGAVNGYSSGYGSPLNFYNNNIYNLTTTGAATAASGLTFSGPTGNIYNNYISDIKVLGSSSATGVNGIVLSGGTTHSVYYNTIYLNATSTSTTTFGSNGIYVSSATPVVDLRNNIVVNNSTPGITGGNTTAFRYASTTLTNISANTNNNCWYAGASGPTNLIFWDGTNTDQTIAGYKARVSPREGASVTEMPSFINVLTPPYNLKLSTTLPTQCESGGQVIAGIDTDFENDLRFGAAGYAGSGTAPDMGADEGNFIFMDLNPPAIGYTPLSDMTIIGARTLRAKITDGSGVPQTGTGAPVLYWNINGGVWNSTQGIYLSADTFEFTFAGTAAMGDMVRYYVVAQDNATIPNAGCFPALGAGLFSTNPPAAATPPAIPSVFVYILPVTGIKTIDNTLPTAGNNYNNFQDAFLSLNLHGVGTGGATFNVVSGQVFNATVFTSNTGALTLTATGTATDPVVFQKFGAGANPVINFIGTSGTSDAGIQLNGSDYITFDGINLVDAGTTSADYIEFGLHLFGLPTNGCSYNIFKNGLIDLTRTNTSSRGIRLLGNTASAATGSNNYNKFYNNTIQDAAQGYYMLGTSSYKNIGNEIGNEASGVSIIQGIGFLASTASSIGIYTNYQDSLKIFNTLIDTISGSYGTYPTTVGIYMLNTSNVNIYGNTIRQITTAAGDPVGINFESATGNSNAIYNNTLTQFSATVSGNINSMRLYTGTNITLNVYGNEIKELTNAGAGTTNGIYCSYTTCNIKIYNNKLWNWHNTGATANIIYGIYLAGTGNTYTAYNNMIYDFRAPASTGTAPAVSGIRAEASTCNLYHNTVLLNYVSTAAANTSAAMYANAAANLNMQNNIFVNKTDVTVGTRAAAFWYSSATYTNISALTNNNLYFAGSVPAAKNPIFYNGTTAYAALADYQTALVTKDQSSMTEDVPFVNSTVAPYNVHVQQFVPTFAESNGVKISGIDIDIDGETRFGSPGYIGTGMAPDVGADEFTGTGIFTCTLPAPGNTIASANMICLGTPVTLTLQNPTPGIGVLYQWKQSSDGIIYSDIPGANISSLTLTPVQVTWYLCNVTCLNGPVTTPSAPVLITFSQQITSTTPDTRCGVGSLNLGASTGSGTIAWYSAPSGGVSIGTGSSFTTPVIASTTTFYVASEGQTLSSGNVTIGNGTTVNSATSYPTFVANYWYQSWQQMVYTAAELQAMGLSAGNITALAFYVNVLHTPVTSPTDFQVSLGAAPGTTLSTWQTTGLSTCYGPAIAPTMTASAWNTLTFTTPYFWDGVSNIIVDIRQTEAYGSGNTTITNTAQADYKCIYAYASSSNAAYWSSNPSPTSTYSRMNARFTGNLMSICSSPRIPVIATVTPPPALVITPDATVCNNEIIALDVTSNLPDFSSYIWSPATDLFTDPAATIPYVASTSATTVYLKTTNPGLYVYTCTASNAALCVNVDTVSVTVLPALPVLTSTPEEICVSGNMTITTTPSTGYGAAAIQWKTSSDNTIFTDIPGANSLNYTTPVLTATQYYQLVIKNSFGVVCNTLNHTGTVNNPLMLSTVPATRCGIGTVTLEATANAGASVSWFNAPIGGAPLGTGTLFTTPVINTTTDYYVAASIGETISQVGAPNTNISASKSGQTTTSAGINFTVLAPSVTIQSVDIYPNAAVGSPFTIYVRTGGTSGTVVASYSGLTTVQGTNTDPQLQIVPVNFVIPQGTGYVMHLNPNPSTIRNSGGDAFPYTLPGVITLTSSTGSSYYYYMYNWTVKVGCSSPRTMVTASVTPPPALTISPNQTVCNDAVAMMTVTSVIPDFDTYTWTPAVNLFTDAAATLPYVPGTSATTVYARTTAAGATTYTCTATNTLSQCVNIATSVVTVKAPIVLAVSALPNYLCPGNNSQLNVTASQAGGTPIFTYLWTPSAFITGQELLQNPLATALTATTIYTVVVTGDGCSATESVTVTVQSGPSILVQPLPTFGCIGGTTSLSVTATGPGISYQWRKWFVPIDPIANPSALTSNLVLSGLTTLDAGIYDVVVSASCGTPVTSAPANLTIYPVPTATAASNSPICEGTSLMLTGSTDIGTEFRWSGPNGFSSLAQSPTISNIPLGNAGTYSFFTIQNGCTSLVSTTVVSLDPMPVFTSVTATPAIICSGEISNLAATTFTEQTANKYLFNAGSGALLDPMTGATSVLLSSNDDTPTPAPAPIGFTFNYEGVDYTQYSVSPDGWVSLGGLAVSQYTNDITSTQNIPKLFPYWDDLATGLDGYVKTTVTGTAPNRIFVTEWFVTIPRNITGSANSTFQLWLYETTNKIEFRYGTMGVGAMTASVGITGANSAKYQSITIPGGTASSTAANNNVADQPVSGTIYTLLPPPPVSGYAWTPAASVVSPLLPTTATNPLTATTTFTVTATGGNNCLNSQNVTVTVNPLPTATTTLAPVEYICPGGTKLLTVDLTGTPPWTLTVGDGSGTMVVPGILTTPWTYPVSPTVATTYSVTSVTDANCTNTSNLSVLVDLHPVPAPVITGYTTPICADGSTILNAGSGYTTYLWSDNSTGQTLTVNASAIGPNSSALYTVTVTNQFGCIGSNSVTIATFPSLTANAGPDVAVCPGLSTQLDANGGGGGGIYIQYDWSPAAGLSAINIKNPIATPAATTTYTVTVTDINNCTAVDDVVVTVYPVTPVDFTGLNAAYCIDAPAALLTGSPIGGIFSGTGIVGNTFDPAVAGAGGPYTITYTYTDGNNCINSMTHTVTVNPLPVVSFSGLNPAYCIDAASATLVGNPTGGTFTGAGITGSIFNPATAGVGGPYTITYTYTDGNSCINSTTQQVSVNPLPVVSFSGLNAAYCIDGPIVTLTGTPALGTFSGPGIVGNSFNPAIAGAGTHTITYTFTDANSCTNSESQTVTVNPLPIVSFTGLNAAYCIDAPDVTLTGIPAGGTFTGTGITVNTFSPAGAGVGGPYAVTYTYTDLNNCTNSTSQLVTVNPLPVVTFSATSNVCVDAAPFALYGGTPSGGSYTGPNTVAGVFYPINALGNNLLTYTFTDGNGCVNSATHTIAVHPLPVLTFPPVAPVCITVAPFALNMATPAGGTYSGAGVTANTFDPNAAGAGIHTITYTYMDGNSCWNTITQTIQVYALPVLTMSANPTICAGFSAPISVSAAGAGGFTYLWNNAAQLSDPTIANPVATPAATTTFTVTVTDVNLCQQTGSVAVTVNALPAITISADHDLCLGYSSQLSSQALPLGGYSFAWSNGASLSGTNVASPLATPTVTTTYTVTYTNLATNCQNTASVVVTVLPNPIPAIDGVNANYCFDASPFILSGTPAGGSFTIDNTPTAQFNPATLGVGSHLVVYTVTHANNCVASKSQTVIVRELPTVNAGVDQSTCAGLPVYLDATPAGGASPYQYAWTPAATLNNAAIKNPIATPLTDQTYTVVVTDFYGCTGSDQMVVFATAIPTANAGADVAICYGQQTQLLASGGVNYSWSPAYGLSNPNIDNPIAAPGVTTTYTVTASSICGVATDQVVVTVNSLPSVLFLGLPNDICIDAPAITLTGGPNGGIFTGPGMTGNVFNPAQAGVGGPYTITYTYTNSNNCTNSHSSQVTVRPLPVVNFTGLNLHYCLTAPAATLIATPAGGTFSGPGIVGNTFNPALAGVGGPYTITYTYIDQYSCSNFITKQVSVHQPVMNITGLNTDYCVNGLAAQLTGTPAGGSFSGTGINGTLFVPSVAGVGVHVITYTFTDMYGCTNAISQSTTVNPLTPVSFSGLPATACVNDPIITLTGLPAGGVFSGPGISGNTFNPAGSGTGTRVIYYTISGPGICTNTTTQTIVVNSLPAASFSGLSVKYCISAAPVTLNGSPAGGVFSGPGITGNIFDPAAAGTGIKTITYTVSNANGCSNTMSATTTVNPLPVLSIAGLAGPYCVNNGIITMTGTPAGGTFSGMGVTLGGTFNPAVAGVGTHPVSYTYTDANNCVNTITQSVVINALPVVTFAQPAPVCQGSGSFVLAGGSPLGGAYTGNGVMGGAFYPTLSGTGTFPVTYTYTAAGTGCTSSAIANVVVNTNPIVNAGTDTTILYNTDASLLGSATGGLGSYSWSWTPAASVLNPTAYGTMTSVLTSTQVFTLTASDIATGCMGSDQVIVNVSGSVLDVFATASPASICIGNSSVLNAFPTGGSLNYLNYFWTSVPAGSYNATQSITVSPTVTTVYKVKIYDGYNYDSTTVTVVVNPLPVVGINPIPAGVCMTATPIALTGTPAGGVFTGNGIVANVFYPNLAGVGSHTLTYTYTNANSCTSTAAVTIQVYAMPTVTIGFVPASICINAAPITLVGTPAGGTFSGAGVTGNTFNPATAGLGNVTISYTYSNANNCSDIATKTINVLPLPTVAIVGLANSFCAGGNPVVLTGSPAGGTFSGPGTGANSFSPVSAGVGTHVITYQYTNSNGCVNTTSQTVTVNALPTVTFVGLQNQYCVNATPVTLVATPAGGTFSGVGVTGNSFNPAVPGVGYTSITYAYTSPTTGCSKTITANINVRPISTLGIVAPVNACINGSAVTLTGSPTGGTFSGPGMTGSSFNPVTAGLGAKTITYTYTNSYGCTSSTTATITVNALTTGSIGGLALSYCLPSSQVVSLSGYPTGGTFSGPGMSNNLFSPHNAGTGAKTITYTFTDIHGCVNSTTANTTINTTVATFTGLAAHYCLNSTPVTLTGNTAGSATGTFSGPGISGNTFNPALAGVGGHTITYTLTNPTTGCTGVVTHTTVVHSLPLVSILNLPASQCVNGPVVTVATSPATGGTLSGPGVTGYTFNPATAGIGTHTISYSWTNANNCTVTATQTVVVHGLPNVAFTGLAATYCELDPVANLTGAPVGGIFSGPGVSGPKFHPLAATPGTHTVSYTYKDFYGCTNIATQSVVVYANPVITLVPDTTICINHIITLNAGAGGTTYQWSTGATTQTAVIDASVLGTGYHQIFVTVTNANNCTSVAMVKVIISACEGIDNPDNATAIQVYPNPSSGVFQLLFSNFEGTYDLTIYNDLGQLIKEETLTIEDKILQQKQVDLSSHPTGVYYIRLMNATTTKVIKVVIN